MSSGPSFTTSSFARNGSRQDLNSIPSDDTQECLRRAMMANDRNSFDRPSHDPPNEHQQQKTPARKPRWPFQFKQAEHSGVVDSVMICNSQVETDIELQQVWEEADDGDRSDRGRPFDKEEADTTISYESTTMAERFEDRIGQPLIHTDGQKLLRLVVIKKVAENSPEFLKEPRSFNSIQQLLAVEDQQISIVCKGPTTNKQRLVETQQLSSEVGCVGTVWRSIFRQILMITLDEVNRLRITRLLQIQMGFLTGYEALLLSQVIDALDDNRNIRRALRAALQNRNISRILLQTVGSRHDFLYHWGTAVEWNRTFDLLGKLPVFGVITRFPATENFPSTRNHALASIFRVLLGQGNWLTRVLTGGREGLITDDPNAPAQNLTAESNGFELANRNQYGTNFGRKQTNKFRADHRLPTDESLVRTFVAQPISTTTNNGVFHTLRKLASHWENMLRQEYGNFAHQRMEQLDPFETLRIQMPEMLLTMASLRGRNIWDAQVLGKMIQRLQSLRSSESTDKARRLAMQLKLEIVAPVCGGVRAAMDPFKRWLDAIVKSLDLIQAKSQNLNDMLKDVELGIRLGYDIMMQLSWKVPSDKVLSQAILHYIHGESADYDAEIACALERTSPRDKRTLVELVRKDLGHMKPAKLLLRRVGTLLQRELRRNAMDRAIMQLSKGESIYEGLVQNEWYWVEDRKGQSLCCFVEKLNEQDYVFKELKSGYITVVGQNQTHAEINIRCYIPIAEAITRAQKVFMTIELEYTRVFTYNAFMEFTSLRRALRRLNVVSQMACDQLDNGRLNVLSEIKSRGLMYNSDPQNLIVVGGGPAGLMTCLHCAENCLHSGGVLKLFEARDSFHKGGSTYERAQIVRLDARWIAMMRYHLGTVFEDTFIPASGETNSQLGNTLPAQNFVEITIKDLENMLHVEVSRFWSRGVIDVYTDARAKYDPMSNSLVKAGGNLKVGDVILRNVDAEGYVSEAENKWKVVELIYTELLDVDDLKVGREYCVYSKAEKGVLPFALTEVDLESKVYHFKSMVHGVSDIDARMHDLPSVYPAGTETRAHADVHKIILQHVEKNNRGKYSRAELLAESIRSREYKIDIGGTHVVEAIGKPSDSLSHFEVTTSEPYGVCCLEGLKVSFGMHNFGEKRWGSGLLDDLRSIRDDNTRIIGDFTKMVRVHLVVVLMTKVVTSDSDWVYHFNMVANDPSIRDYMAADPIVAKLLSACSWLAENSKNFQRKTLQTRFFEVGDNFYLGMELPREFVQWKLNLTAQMTSCLRKVPEIDESKIRFVQGELAGSIDRLWYFATLETIRKGDVYNPGARWRVPKLYTISSNIIVKLSSLPVGESFRFIDSATEKYEILAKNTGCVIVRNVEGYVFRVDESLSVKRDSNLTRSPDGNDESKVAIATFPVSHFVNHRTMRLSDHGKGLVFAFLGDEQASPHFMRYSGLTGSGINAMSFNIFLKGARKGMDFTERMRNYSKETNWSNGEVVQRGTGNNFGVDGFLRPGFTFDKCIAYLYEKVVEYEESLQSTSDLLTLDWQRKLAASMIPRGMELNRDFTAALLQQWKDAVHRKLVIEAMNDDRINSYRLEEKLLATKAMMDSSKVYSDNYWDDFRHRLSIDYVSKAIIEKSLIPRMKCLNHVCRLLIDQAARDSLFNERISSENENQPRSVDAIVDDFAIEAQSFANTLTLSAAFGAGTLAFRLVDISASNTASAVLGILNIIIAFATMTNVSRYKIRNEEARVDFADHKLPIIQKRIFSLLNNESRIILNTEKNPFVAAIEKEVRQFQRCVIYYDLEIATTFKDAYAKVKTNFFDESGLQALQKLITRSLLVDTYHANSYVQESLVRLFEAVEEWLVCLRRSGGTDGNLNEKARVLFKHLYRFKRRLEPSLQRGAVRWGFLKARHILHMDLFITLRFFYNALWSTASTILPAKSCCLAPIEHETISLLKQVTVAAKLDAEKRLSREVADIRGLYWATRESDIASVIFLVAFLTFATSAVFSVARLLSIGSITDFAFYAATTSALGAILAVFHLVRKLIILVNLWVLLGEKVHEVPDIYLRNLRIVRSVTLTQAFLTLTRLLAAAGAAVALPLSVAETGYSDRIPTIETLPFWIAAGSIVAAVGAGLFFVMVEYVIRYHLPTDLGPFVCNIFRAEISDINEEMAQRPTNSVITHGSHQKRAYEYTANAFLHRYRFDTVFAADRFGQILQYLQSPTDMNQFKEGD